MGGGNLPNEIVEAIAISNSKAIGEQPAILSNLSLATQILNNNMQQQMMLAQQQALNQIALATTAKCVSLITQSGSGKPSKEEAQTTEKAVEEVKMLAEQLMKQMSSFFPKQQPGPESGQEDSPSNSEDGENG